ncbi:MAG TPA: hypothetical protein DCZ72_09680 [Armatimonadetes bacterium]|nr:hypothetical protein [Armatimonadota bacterium]
MDSKKTLILGAGLLVLGLILCIFVFPARVLTVLAGGVALALLLAGALMLYMGLVDSNETAAQEALEAADEQRAADMAARA